MRRVVDEFWAAVALAASSPATAGPYLSGSRMAWAAAHVLGAQGAGISLADDSGPRLPWGASSDHAAQAEQLQFTTGEGPCLAAFAHRVPVMAPASVIAQSWPLFAGQLHRRTPYRSIYSAPLHTAGTIDLYFTDPDGVAGLDIADTLTITRQVFTAMINDQVVSLLDAHPALRVPSLARRTEVSVAMGMVTVARQVNFTDALTLMRAHALAHDLGVDEVAAGIVNGRLDPQQLGATPAQATAGLLD